MPARTQCQARNSIQCPDALLPLDATSCAGKLRLSIHAQVHHADDFNRGCGTWLAENHVAALCKLAISGHHVIAFLTNGGVLPQRVKGIIELFEVAVALRNTPFAFGVAANGSEIIFGFAGEREQLHLWRASSSATSAA